MDNYMQGIRNCRSKVQWPRVGAPKIATSLLRPRFLSPKPHHLLFTTLFHDYSNTCDEICSLLTLPGRNRGLLYEVTNNRSYNRLMLMIVTMTNNACSVHSFQLKRGAASYRHVGTPQPLKHFRSVSVIST